MKMVEKNKYTIQKIGKEPVVILPMRDWERIQRQLEDFAMSTSPSFTKKLTIARASKKFFSATEAKKLLLSA
jgi:hypothetical protein